MEKLYNFFWSKVRNTNVFDEYGDCVGKLYDMYVMTEEGYPKIIGYKVKKDGEIVNYEFKAIDFKRDRNKSIYVSVKGARDILPTTYSYLLSRHLLDRSIVDINGKKLVRVNDVRLAEMAGDIRIVAVDAGINGVLRKYKVYKIFKLVSKMFKHKTDTELILWDNLESIDMVQNRSIKLNVPYKKISKLHPADLADIIESMDIEYRNKIFENLDDDLAAETLEEIEPGVQAEILEHLSESRTTDVLENMPNDEIADILDEVDDATAEKILISMEKEDAEEIRNLMKYGETTVGSIMNKDFISFNINITVSETLEILKEMEIDEEVAYYIYIVDEDGIIEGLVRLIQLLQCDGDSTLRDIMDTNIITVSDEDHRENAFEAIIKYNLFAVPVVDRKSKLCGIVVIHDLLDEYLQGNTRKIFK